MKKILKISIAIIVLMLSFVFIAGAAEESKYEYHDSSWYLSEDEATAFMGFIYNLAPEDLAEKEFASLGVDLLTGKYADSPEDEYIIKMTFCEVALTQMNSKVAKYDHASVITSENLINYLKEQVGDNPEEQYINSTCNGYLNKMKESLKKVLLICNLSDSEYEIYESLNLQISGYETIVGIAPKAMKYAKAAKAVVEGVIFLGSSSRRDMYEYMLTYIKQRFIAESTIEGFEFAMGCSLLDTFSDPFLNWKSEDHQKVLNRWAELFYWLMKDVGEVEFTNDNTSGTTTSTLEPVEFVPGTGTYEGKCGEKVEWHLDASTGVLNIYGEGSMDNYTSASQTPWYSYRKYINYVRVTDGVISIGNYAFAECTTLDKVYLSADVYNIGSHAFYNCVAMRLFVVDGIVNNIGQYAFANCKNLVYFNIPERVTNINNGLFYGCTGLVYVELSENLVSIGSSAFYNCKGLTEFTIPDSVTSIGSSAFYNCSGLTSITIPDGITSIGSSVFYNCSGLTEFTIPDSVTSIGSSAFSDCSGLTEFTIPDSVISIGSSAFSNCLGLTELTISASTEIYYAFGGCTNIEKITITKGSGIMQNYDYQATPWWESGCSTIVIEDGVTNIGAGAFEYCKSLTSVTIPESVTNIGNNAFEWCTSLQSITIPDSVTTIGDHAFRNCTDLMELTIPASAKIDNGRGSFVGCTNIEKITITKGSGVMQDYKIPTSSTTYTCYENTPWYISGCSMIIIEDGVTNIGNNAFNDCYSLQSVTIPDSVTTIGYSAFESCKNLQSVTIPDSVTTIGFSAFSSCDSLQSVTIPDSVTTIGNYAFENCKSLESVTIPDSVTTIGNYVFHNCKSLQSITIPDSVTTIGKAAFYNCSGLTELTIPASAEIYNGSYTFGGCINIEKITITKGSGIMQDYSYDNSSSDTFYKYTPWYISGCSMVIIEDGVTNIGNYAFGECYSLQSITIPDSVTNIGNNAFEWCDSLQSVTIPDSVTTIGDYTFYYCDSLEKVYASDVESWLKIKFSDSYSNPMYYAEELYFNGELATDIVIPGSVTTIGTYAFYNCSKLAELTIPNKDCSLYDSSSTIYSKTTIKAPCGSPAHNYAKKYNRNFVSLGHEYASVITAPTCTKGGYTTYTCSCGDSYKDDYVKEKGHSYNKVVTKPTCTQKGYTTYICSCGDSYVSDEMSSTGHSYKTVITAPTCTEDGYTTYICSCGDSYEEVLPATGHDFDGSVCKNCGYDKSDDCSCNCHKSGFMGFIWKILKIFYKLFKTNAVCECGVKH